VIQGIGHDLLEIHRISQAIGRHGPSFLNRLFTPAEQAYCLQHKESARHFAGRFAAKEAVAKALGTGFGTHLSWLDLEILPDEYGKPTVHLSGEAKSHFGDPRIHLTITHGKELASAFALLEERV